MTVKTKVRAFSLVELVIVVVIIGVIAAIAVPRISRGARGAGEAALRADLAALRSAIDLYAAEHSSTFPAVATFVNQLTLYSDDLGATVAVKDATHIYGPYLRVIPGLKVNGDGAATDGIIGDTTVAAAAAAGVGWVYTVASGTIAANTGAATDDAGTPYNAY